MRLPGGWDRDGTGAFRRATRLPNAQIHPLASVLLFIIREEQAERRARTLSATDKMNAGCKMKAALMFRSSGLRQRDENRARPRSRCRNSLFFTSNESINT